MIDRLTRYDFFKPRDSPIAMARKNPQWARKMHTHEFEELVFITGGSGTHVLENEEFVIKRGDVFVINGDMAHGYKDSCNLHLINIFYEKNELAVPMQDIYTLPGYQVLFHLEPIYRIQNKFKDRLTLADPELDYALSIINEIDRELRNQDRAYKFMICALFMQLVCFVSRCYQAMSSTVPSSLLRIGRVINFMELNFDQQINLNKLSSIADMSIRNFSRDFRAITGDSPINYLLNLRIGKAMTLLRGTNRSVTDIAYEVGFLDSNYFTRQFRRITGFNPKYYRTKSQ